MSKIVPWLAEAMNRWTQRSVLAEADEDVIAAAAGPATPKAATAVAAIRRLRIRMRWNPLGLPRVRRWTSSGSMAAIEQREL